MSEDSPTVEGYQDFMDFGVYDIEASNWNEVEAIGCFDGKGMFYADVERYPSVPECIKNSIEYMINHEIDIWYAHNGGKYDIKFFLDYLFNNYYLEFCYASSSLILVEVYEAGVEDDYEEGRYKGSKPKNERKLCEFRDTFALFPMSLKSLTHGFDVNHKKQDYDQYEEHENREEMLEYLKYDCIGLWEVLADFMVRTNTPEVNLTIASESMNQYKNRFGGNEYLDNLQTNTSKEEYFRNAYYGGRTEVFERYGENLYYYDFHSMYPAVMKHQPYPCGDLVRTSEFKPDKLGIYKVTWTSPDPEPNIPLLPVKQDGKLKFTNGTNVTGWYYSPEIKQAIEDGHDIKVEKGFYWTDQQYMFEDYINNWYGIKEESEGAMYLISKLFLNSLYGKFGQSRTVSEVTQKTPTKEQVASGGVELIDEDIGLYSKETQVHSDYIYPYVAGFVTSYGRLKLYRALKEADKKGTVYYCDTDSLIVDHPLQTSDELGALGLEDEVKKGYFLFPKIYAYQDPQGGHHLKAKGFKSKDLTFEDYRNAFRGDMSGFDAEWEG